MKPFLPIPATSGPSFVVRLLRALPVRRKLGGLIPAVTLLAAVSCPAAVLITVGDISLLPGLSGQQVEIRIDHDGPPIEVGGLEFAIQVADGGPAAGGVVSGPVVQAVDLLTGTMFEGKSFGGQFPSIDNTGQQQFWNVLSLTAELPSGSGQRLARVTFDTTGFAEGTWTLSLAGMPFAQTRLLDRGGNPIDVTIQNGTLAVVPEPAACAWIGGLLLGLAGWRFRRHFKAGMAAGAVVLGTTTSPGALLIAVEDAILLPNLPGQEVRVWIDNTGPTLEIGGLDFAIQLADGGPAVGGVVSGPVIQSVNLLGGTPFEVHNLGGQFADLDNQPQRQFHSVVGTTAELPSGTGQLLATVVLDTTGYLEGSWTLSLAGMWAVETKLLDRTGLPFEADIRNGVIAVVPEHGAWAWTGAALVLLLVHRGRVEGAGRR
ncbi:MAG: hypothetical protein KF833_06620 [Verrucomicrobiae bacterium]|nr:hypothetical protein [Verrucomicrobiae bacterium]